MAIAWQESMSTGIPLLDRHHQQLIESVNALARRLSGVDRPYGRDELGTLLAILFAYCRDHFGFEEQCMNVLRCPTLQANRETHAQFQRMLEQMRARGNAGESPQVLAVELEAFLSKWLLQHICSVDSPLLACARRHVA